jgi:hypothetical protein
VIFISACQTTTGQEEHTLWLNSKTSLVYETIQNKSKELVKIGVLAMCACSMKICLARSFFQTSDEFKPTSSKFRAQETAYEKYDEDRQLTKQRQDVRPRLMGSLHLTDLRNTS